MSSTTDTWDNESKSVIHFSTSNIKSDQSVRRCTNVLYPWLLPYSVQVAKREDGKRTKTDSKIAIKRSIQKRFRTKGGSCRYELDSLNAHRQASPVVKVSVSLRHMIDRSP